MEKITTLTSASLKKSIKESNVKNFFQDSSTTSNINENYNLTSYSTENYDLTTYSESKTNSKITEKSGAVGELPSNINYDFSKKSLDKYF